MFQLSTKHDKIIMWKNTYNNVFRQFLYYSILICVFACKNKLKKNRKLNFKINAYVQWRRDVRIKSLAKLYTIKKSCININLYRQLT